MYPQYDTFEKCMDTSNTHGYKYFALQDVHTDTGFGACFVSNDFNSTTKYGPATNCVQQPVGIDKARMLGGSWSNYVYVHNFMPAAVVSPLLSQPALPSKKIRFLVLDRFNKYNNWNNNFINIIALELWYGDKSTTCTPYGVVCMWLDTTMACQGRNHE